MVLKILIAEMSHTNQIDGTPYLLIIPFFCQPPQPYSALLVYQFWRILPVSPFIPDSLFINSCAQSTVEA